MTTKMYTIAMALTKLEFVPYGFVLFTSLLSIFLLRRLIKPRPPSSATVRRPPSPPAIPFIGHLHLLTTTRLPISLQTLSRRHGPLMHIRIGPSPFTVASSAATAKQILKHQELNFSSKFVFGPNDYNIYPDSGFITGPHGPYWRFMKKLCITKLFAGAQLRRLTAIREREIAALVKSTIAAASGGEGCDLSTGFTTLTNNLICKMALSRRYSENPAGAVEMRRLIVKIMELTARLGVFATFGPMRRLDPFGRGKRLKDSLWEYDRVLEEMMKEYEVNLENGYDNDNDNEGMDLMDIVLRSYRDPNAEVQITRNQIKFFFLELFFASIDTSSASLQWAMAKIIEHPRIQTKLRDELASVVGDRLVNQSDIPNLPYLRAVVKETMRLHTPAPIIFRECTTDCKINGYDVPSGSRILINAYAITRDPATWSDPEEFVPERWVDVNGDVSGMEVVRTHDHSFIPFGGGRRGCFGAVHALTVMHPTIGAMIQCFDWKLRGSGDGDVRVGSGFSGTMAGHIVGYPTTRFDPFKG